MEKRELKHNIPIPSREEGRILYALIIIGLLFIIAGLWLMSGESTTDAAFNPDIFSPRRIKVAPIVCLLGFLIEGVACMKK